ncbi:hypothetical protein DAHU10_000020 [Hanseniaspora uvarum]|nr:hypothetical protein DAHU10_000020 [Hanseniaspora uvarum]
MIDIKYSVLPNLDGSCEYSTYNSKVITGVSGPLEPKQRHRLPLQSAIEVFIKPSHGVGPSTREVLMQDKLATALQSVIVTEKYPRELIQVNAQILSNPFDSFGSLNEDPFNEIVSSMIDLNSCFNSIFISLIDSAVALKSCYYSNLFSINEKNEVINITNVESLEDFQSLKHKSIHLMVLEIEENKPTNILLMDSKGSFNDDDLVKIIDAAQINTQVEFKKLRSLIKEKVQNDYIWKA